MSGFHLQVRILVVSGVFLAFVYSLELITLKMKVHSFISFIEPLLCAKCLKSICVFEFLFPFVHFLKASLFLTLNYANHM